VARGLGADFLVGCFLQYLPEAVASCSISKQERSPPGICTGRSRRSGCAIFRRRAHHFQHCAPRSRDTGKSQSSAEQSFASTGRASRIQEFTVSRERLLLATRRSLPPKGAGARALNSSAATAFRRPPKPSGVSKVPSRVRRVLRSAGAAVGSLRALFLLRTPLWRCER